MVVDAATERRWAAPWLAAGLVTAVGIAAFPYTVDDAYVLGR